MNLQITTQYPGAFNAPLGTWDTIFGDAEDLTSYYEFGNASVENFTFVPNAGEFSYLGGSNATDYLFAQEGSWILGRDGDDFLTSYSARDNSPIRSYLDGGNGNDQLTALNTDAIFTGGSGFDQFRVSNSDVIITDFTKYQDTLWISQTTGVAQIQTDQGLVLDSGTSQIHLLGVTEQLTPDYAAKPKQ